MRSVRNYILYGVPEWTNRGDDSDVIVRYSDEYEVELEITEAGELHTVIVMDVERQRAPYRIDKTNNKRGIERGLWHAAGVAMITDRSDILERAGLYFGDRHQHSRPVMGVGFSGNKYAA